MMCQILFSYVTVEYITYNILRDPRYFFLQTESVKLHNYLFYLYDLFLTARYSIT